MCLYTVGKNFSIAILFLTAKYLICNLFKIKMNFLINLILENEKEYSSLYIKYQDLYAKDFGATVIILAKPLH